jgi:phosphatidylglycerophosphate synthase
MTTSEKMPSPVEVYRKTRKLPDLAWNRWVCRPVAAVVVAGLSGRSVTPNQVTLSAFVVASVSAAMIAWLPGYWGLLAGVVLFELSYVLDCVDGMLARWREVVSPAGHLLDFLMDEIKAFLILAATAFRLFSEHSDVRYLLLGLAGLVALATGVAVTTFLRRPEIAASATAGPSAPRKSSAIQRALALPERFAKLLVHYPSYILFTALCGRIEFYFFPYIAVHGLYALRALATVAVRFGR